MGQANGERVDEGEAAEEEACGPGTWLRFALQCLRWLVYMTAFWLVLIPARHHLRCSLGEGALADVLYVALACLLLLIIVAVDRRLVRR